MKKEKEEEDRLTAIYLDLAEILWPRRFSLQVSGDSFLVLLWFHILRMFWENFELPKNLFS